MKRILNDVAGVALGYTDADATVTTTNSNAMKFAALVISRTGRPGQVLKVASDTWEGILGKPFHTREGAFSESLRHIDEAADGGAGYVVRVMASDAKYPILTVGAVVDTDNAVVTSAISYSGEPILDVADLFSIYLVDGDNELPRKLSIVAADAEAYGDGFYIITLTQTDTDGTEKIIDKQVVSLTIGATDVDNNAAFIEDKLENFSTYLRAVTNPSNLGNFVSIKETQFAGGTSGDLTTIGTDEYAAALAILRAEDPTYHALISAGCYDDSILASLRDLADDKNIEFFLDVEPNLSYPAALERQISLAMSSYFAFAYHMPYSAVDNFYSTRTVWGLSGFVFAAKAKGVALKSPTGGWHYTPAGATRATITRSGLKLNANAGVPDYEGMVVGRLNKLGKNEAGALMIDDSLSCRPRKDYLRFENVVAVDCAIGRAYVELATSLKHGPDGVTLDGLEKGMTRILDGFVSSECLVKPSDPADGTSPYIVTITKVEIDLWSVKWAICVSGSARRFIGQARLLK
jgi:hypothetical protein